MTGAIVVVSKKAHKLLHPSRATRRKNASTRGVYVFDGGTSATSQDLRISRDGRRATLFETTLEIPKPAPAPLDQDFDMSSFSCPDPSEEGPTVVVSLTEKRPAKRYQVSDIPLKAWLPYKHDFLDECIRSDGWKGHSRTCHGCKTYEAVIRCKDCFGGFVYCQDCAVRVHTNHPLHTIERWNGTHFVHETLKGIGYRFQLGHADGSRCLMPSACNKDFMVIHTNGIHPVSFDYCSCGELKNRPDKQLLRAGWWPCTVYKPKTCVSFVALKHFHLNNLQGNLTAFDFYRAIELETDNTGLIHLPERLASFMLAVRQYRFIKLAKRGGRGHDPQGIDATKNGELAVICPSCPLPGINLPEGWHTSAFPWLYRLILANDCNFRLSGRLRSSDEKDPGLGTGLSYFVPQAPYHEHILKHANEQEISSCAGFAALLNANLKRSKGLRSTGVAGVVCARHQLWRPNGLGDLQKGERYCNVDFVLMSSICGILVTMLLISYDIACQWSKNLASRMQYLPENIRLNLDAILTAFGIPKFHLAGGHGDPCQGPYSLNFKDGVGRTDGEGIERNWAKLNGAAHSTREMGPGSRHDTLDDTCGHANWRKVVDLGNSLAKKMREAMPSYVEHHDAFVGFDESLRKVREEDVKGWETSLNAWEADNSRRNPFLLSKEKRVTKLRLQQAQKEAEDFNQGVPSVHEVSPGTFLSVGIELEDLKAGFSGNQAARTDNQLTKLQERRTAFQRKLQRFRELQVFHMPGLSLHQDGNGIDANRHLPERVFLHMPSGLSPAERATSCSNSLCEIEAELRYAHASDALDDLRHHLRLRTFTNKFKVKNVTGQRPNTRARTLQKQIDTKVRAGAAKYRRSRLAYLNLVGPGDWEITLRVLEDRDIRALNERALTESEEEERRRVRMLGGTSTVEDEEFELIGGSTEGSEGRRTLSWIWFAVPAGGASDAGMHEALRVEWCKAKARAKRWREEIMLLNEEMRRTIETLRWKSDAWKERSLARTHSEPSIQEGLNAYATKQASISHHISLAFAEKWRDLRLKAHDVLSSKDPLDVMSDISDPSPGPSLESYGEEEDEALAEAEEDMVDDLDCWDAEGVEFDV